MRVGVAARDAVARGAAVELGAEPAVAVVCARPTSPCGTAQAVLAELGIAAVHTDMGRDVAHPAVGALAGFAADSAPADALVAVEADATGSHSITGLAGTDPIAAAGLLGAAGSAGHRVRLGVATGADQQAPNKDPQNLLQPAYQRVYTEISSGVRERNLSRYLRKVSSASGSCFESPDSSSNFIHLS